MRLLFQELAHAVDLVSGHGIFDISIQDGSIRHGSQENRKIFWHLLTRSAFDFLD